MDVKAQARALSAGRQIKAEVTAPAAAPAVETEVEVETPDEQTENAPKYKAGDKVVCAGKSYTVEGAPFQARCYDIKSADGSTAKAMEVNLEPGEAKMPTDTTTPAPQPEASAALLALQAENDKLKAMIASREKADDEAARKAALDNAGCKAGLRAMVEATLVRADGQTWDQAVTAHKAAFPDAYEAKQEIKPAAPVATMPKLPAQVDTTPATANTASVPGNKTERDSQRKASNSAALAAFGGRA